jgi:predicted kinase
VLEPFAKKNKLDIVLLCGSPAAGKSTFYWQQLEPLGYARVNQDLLKTVCDLFKLESDFNICYSETNVSKLLGHIWTKASQWP